MATVKLTITMPEHLVDEIRDAVRHGRAESVSAYLTEAARQHGRRETLGDILDDMIAESGPPDAADVARAEATMAELERREAQDRTEGLLA